MARKLSPGHNTQHVFTLRHECFGCGKDNPDGMRLKFYFDEERGRFVGRFRLPRRYQGPPGHVHGGIIATVLDEAMGKVNKLRHVTALTSEMKVQYLKPVPLGKPITVEGFEVRVRGRRHINAAEILNEYGEVLARSRGVFIAIDPAKMFAKFMKNGRGKPKGR
jgi:uncharacterized protein (TIGR00369 family)